MVRALGSRYVLEERLGSGGMGTVYRGVRRDGGADRAIKVLRSDLAEDPVVLTRFLQERTLMLAMSSPHLVGVEDLVVDGDTVAIVMELVAGGSLRDHLNEAGRLPVGDALALVRQVLQGLGVVHGHGIVHRDVKPGNVLLEPVGADGRSVAKLSDFGIARLLESPRLTAASDYVGSTHYAAPELAAGAPPSPSADVYACGVVLYELMTGHTPYASEAPYLVMRKQAEQLPPRGEGIPDPVWRMLLRWLSPDPASRPQDAWGALAELEGAEALLGAQASGLIRDAVQGTPAAVDVPVGAQLASTPVNGHGATRATPAPTAFSAAGAALGGGDPGSPARVQHRAVPADHLEVVRHEPGPAWDAGYLPPEDTAVAGTDDLGEFVAADLMEPRGKDRRVWTRSKPLAAGAAVLLIAGGAAGIAVAMTGSSEPPRFSLTFAPESYPASGVTVSRTWSLNGGDKPTLHGQLTFQTSKALATTVEEVIPKSVAADVSEIAFTPQPRVVERDPIVAYELPAKSGVTIVTTYDIPVAKGDVSMQNLQAWAQEQRNETGTRYRQNHQLARMAFSPASMTVGVGQTQRLRLTGTLQDGSAAPTIALWGATYRVADATVAAVSADGTVRGLAKGRTPVSAQLGGLTASGSVTVVPTATSTPSTAGSKNPRPKGSDPADPADPADATSPGSSDEAVVGSDGRATQPGRTGSGRPSRGGSSSAGTTAPGSSAPGTSAPGTSAPGIPPTSDPVTPPTSDPVTPPTSDPVTPPTSDPVTPPTSDPVTPPTSDPVTPPTSDPVTPPTTDPVTTPPTTDPVTDPPVVVPPPVVEPPVTDPAPPAATTTEPAPPAA